jgi:hypothetical protein
MPYTYTCTNPDCDEVGVPKTSPVAFDPVICGACGATLDEPVVDDDPTLELEAR